MGSKDVPQPDVFLRILPEYGGQSYVEGNRATGAPELIVEISGSSLSRDLGVKLDLYRRAGVREYLTVLLETRQVTWWQLSRGRYRESPPTTIGYCARASSRVCGLTPLPCGVRNAPFKPLSSKASVRRNTRHLSGVWLLTNASNNFR